MATTPASPEEKVESVRRASTSTAYRVVGCSRRAALEHVDETHPRKSNETYVEEVEELVRHHGEKEAKVHAFPLERRKEWPLWSTKTGRFCPERCSCCLFDPCGEGSLSDLKEYGAGVTNYHKFLKWSTVMFLFLALLHSPIMVMNTYGEAVGELNSGGGPYSTIFRTTVGNLGDNPNITTVAIPQEMCVPDVSPGCTMRKREVAAMYALIDFFSCVLFAAGFVWLRYFEDHERDVIDAQNVTTEDYAVFVPELPEWVSEKTLTKHFRKVLRDEDGKPFPIHEIKVVENNFYLLDLFVSQGKLVKKRERIVHAKDRTIAAIHTRGENICGRLFCPYDRTDFSSLVKEEKAALHRDIHRAVVEEEERSVAGSRDERDHGHDRHHHHPHGEEEGGGGSGEDKAGRKKKGRKGRRQSGIGKSHSVALPLLPGAGANVVPSHSRSTRTTALDHSRTLDKEAQAKIRRKRQAREDPDAVKPPSWRPPPCTRAREVYELIVQSRKLHRRELHVTRQIQIRAGASEIEMTKLRLKDAREELRKGACCAFGLMRSIGNLEKKLKRLEQAENEGRKEEADRIGSVAAFITFETEAGYMAALREYPDSFLYRGFCQARDHYIEATKSDVEFVRRSHGLQSTKDAREFTEPRPLFLYDAPPPDTIIWENLDETWEAQSIRQCCTSVLALLLLVASLIVLYVVSVQQRAINSDTTALDCESVHSVVNSTNGLSYHTSYGGWDPSAQPQWEIARESLQDTFPNSPLLNPKKRNDTMRECYCDQVEFGKMQTAELKSFRFAQACSSQYCPSLARRDFSEASSRSYCVEWLKDFFFLGGVLLSASLTISLVNQLLVTIITWLAKFEAHYTEDEKHKALAWKMFLAQYVNTALLATIVNAYFPALTGTALGDRGFADFSPSWYNDVGAPLVVTFVVAAIAPHPLRLYQLWSLCRVRRSVGEAASQRDLEDQYTGPEFDFPRRYAEVITILFACLTFSSAIPVLLWVGFFSCLLSMGLDKLFLLRLNKTPPFYSGSLGQEMTGLLPGALGIHLLVGVWVYGNGNIFRDASNAETTAIRSGASTHSLDDDRAMITREADYVQVGMSRSTTDTALPMFLFFLLLCAIFLLRFLANVLGKLAETLMHSLACGMTEHFFARDEDWEGLPNFSDAISGRLPPNRSIHGITEYNILRVRRYQELFGVTEDWANRHHSIRDLIYFSSATAIARDHRRGTILAETA